MRKLFIAFALVAAAFWLWPTSAPLKLAAPTPDWRFGAREKAILSTIDVNVYFRSP